MEASAKDSGSKRSESESDKESKIDKEILLDVEPSFYYEPNGVPVFKPSMKEFKDFYKYVKSISHYGEKAGLVKVIPPKSWIQKNYTSKDSANEVTVSKPITQCFNCGGLPGGAQRQLNLETKKSFSITEWEELCESERYRPPTFTDRGQLALADITLPSKRRKYSKEASEGKENAKNQSSVSTFKSNTDYFTQHSYTRDAEYIEALERFYWRNLSFQDTMYGADLPGSLFTDDPENTWNVSSLNNLLSSVDIAVPGVTTPYLYFGMYKATFAWHVEDMDLFSINYIHFGAPKIWYVVPPEHRARFERFAAGLFFDEAKQCSEFLRHKTCVISPKLLAQNHIPVHRLVQHSNEFVITFPSAYHQGFNSGFNCAESINFATPAWLKFGQTAKFCECVHDSVQLDVCNLFGLEPPVEKKRGKNLPPPTVPTSFFSKKPGLPKLPKTKCALCPLGNSLEFPLLPTDEPKVFAHEVCAKHVFETWVEQDGVVIGKSDFESDQLNGEAADTSFLTDGPNASGIDLSILDNVSVAVKDDTDRDALKIVHGIDKIPVDRWRLKCSVCLYPGHVKKLGACIQCTRGRCVRAYHVTCAIKAGVPVRLDENGILESFCSSHDPEAREKRKKDLLDQVNLDSKDKFVIGTLVVARYSRQNYEGVVVENRTEQCGCMVRFDQEDDEPNEPCFVPWHTLHIREIPQPKAKKVPVYCTPPRKKKMKSLMQVLLNRIPGPDFSGNDQPPALVQ